MSCDLTHKLFAQKAAADAAAQAELEDRHRMNFLKALDAAPFEVTDWEAKFIGDLLERERWALARKRPLMFSEGQREVIEKLRKTYAHRLPILNPKSEIRNPKEIRSPKPEAERGTCDWLMRGEDGRQRRCGDKAVVRSPGGLEFCREHHETRERWRKRQKELRGRP